jgi:hypothetical protein
LSGPGKSVFNLGGEFGGAFAHRRPRHGGRRRNPPELPSRLPQHLFEYLDAIRHDPNPIRPCAQLGPPRRISGSLDFLVIPYCFATVLTVV